jgi:predicted RNase H-like nuclease
VRVLGVDLAWGEGRDGKTANETGVVAVDPSGRVLDAGWTRGVDETVTWMSWWAVPDTIAMVDAPLIVRNATGMRSCEREVGRRYGRWRVAANASNLALPARAGVNLGRRLAADGWRFADGRSVPPEHGRWLYEVFPYTTLVGAAELGYERQRPVYKRRPRAMTPAAFRELRAVNCDELVRRIGALRTADPPIDIRSHPATARLEDEPTPRADRDVKHREDLIDAVLCAWTGLLWLRHGLARCQVLGDEGDGAEGAEAANDCDAAAPATILAPARPEQRDQARRRRRA